MLRMLVIAVALAAAIAAPARAQELVESYTAFLSEGDTGGRVFGAHD